MKFFKFSFIVFCFAGIFISLLYLVLSKQSDNLNKELITEEHVTLEAIAVVPLETYHPIIDRMPFEKAPPVVAPLPLLPPPIPTPPPLVRAIHIQAVFKNTEGRTAVVYSNRFFNPVKYIYLEVGETKDDILLVEADILAQTATLMKGDKAITLKVGE